MMHKLILRQIKRHLSINAEADIPASLQPFIQAVSEAYQESDQDLAMMERSLELSSKELIGRNDKLSETLDELRNLQSQLVHSAKMAGLGQLVAGVSHEINTPAGAILNAIAEVRGSFTTLLPSLTKVVRHLEFDLHEKYFEACQVVIQSKQDFSTLETRNLAKDLELQLQILQLPNQRAIARNLASVGFNKDNLHLVLDLLKTPEHELIHQSLYELGITQIHVKNIQVAIGRIIQLVKALKLYTHAEDNAISLSNISEDINTTLTILNNRLKRGVVVVKEFEEVPKINCYADQLNQVWTNIINNAVDSMKDSGQVIIRIKKVSNFRICVEIEDNGPGVEQSVKEKIFNPYVTTKPKGEGTGLGLSISKDIVLKHKGSIEFESRPGCTLFRVILPVDLNSIGLNL